MSRGPCRRCDHPVIDSAPKRSLALPAATIGLGSFLLFLVQPLLARRILPWFGGSAAVWTACMLFFQVVLLGGYLYAHLLQKLPARRQATIHLTLLALSLVALPLSPNAAWKPLDSGNPTLRILGLLAATVGLPYLLLSSTSPLMQAWLARERPGFQPYRLFALSNAASLAALLGYPVLVEPFLALGMQAGLWSAGYVLYLLCAGGMAWRSAAIPTRKEEETLEAGKTPTLGMRLLWVLLAFGPSMLLLSVTNHLSTNVAPIPFLWVLPLSLYLLSFILCFDSERWYVRKLFVALSVPALLGMGWLTLPQSVHAPVRLQVAAFSAALFVVCMTAHGELARLRPAPRHLTAIYLSLSAGGALGGLVAGLVAPVVFLGPVEFPLTLIFVAALVLTTWLRDPGPGTRYLVCWTASLLLAGAIGGLTWMTLKFQEDQRRGALARVRNFYGALQVVEYLEGESVLRMLVHGNINHGGQFADAARSRNPIAYYAPRSGAGLALAALGEKGPIRYAVVGLGSGALANYARAGDVVRVYEINPLVEKLARTLFVALPTCEGKVEVVLGDARLSLEREAPQAYDLIAVDAFSSDSIPVHLLTREAFAQYRRHLAPGGVVAVHISNRYLDLEPVLLAEAREGGWQVREVTNDAVPEGGVFSSDWVLMVRDGELLLHATLSKVALPLDGKRRIPPWTDDFSNLYTILR